MNKPDLICLQLSPYEAGVVAAALDSRIKELTHRETVCSNHCTNPAWGKELKEISLTCARIQLALNKATQRSLRWG